MTCPYCGREMEQGYIKSSKQIFWGKEKELVMGEERTMLSQGFWDGFFHGFSVESFYCPDCKKIITSVE